MNPIMWIRNWSVKRKLKRLPLLDVETNYEYCGFNFEAPNPTMRAVIYGSPNIVVGTATYGVSPLNDRLYIYELRISGKHRQGYGTAFLKYLGEKYRLPLAPVVELESSYGFWDKAVRLKVIGIAVTPGLSPGDMLEERKRWAHLEPERDKLRAHILKRCADGEFWQIAVGRGLDD